MPDTRSLFSFLGPALFCRLLGACVLCGLVLAGVSPVVAVQPQLSRFSPTGVQRGTETEVVVSGARLSDVQQLLLYSPGIEVTALATVNDTSFKATFKTAPDCRLGIHAARVRTATGLSDLQTFCVGALPEVKEQEPNSEFSQPQPVPQNCTVSGVVTSEDVDYFVVEAKQGERITAELEGLRLGLTFFDPYLAILNADRFELARADDSPLLWQDGVCSLIAPADGKYIVQVRESSFGGDGNCLYRLHVGHFPRPKAVYPAGGRPGETLTITWLGDAGGPKPEQVTLPATGPTAELFAHDDRGIAPSPNVVRVVDLPNALEAEPNNDPAQATPCTAPGAANGIVASPGDVDHFKFHATKGHVFDVRVFARETLRSPLDSVLSIARASNGAGVAGNDDSGGPDSYVRFTAPEDDDYLIAVRDHLKSGGPEFVYRVEIAPVAPALSVKLPERQQYVSQTLVASRGNRMALMVTAERANFGGDLQLAPAGLPAGVTFEHEPFTADRNEVPALFHVAADAPTAGALVDLVARPADANLKIEGHLRQRTMLVRGQNNRDVWGHDADRLAAVVTDAVPFTLEIVPPKAPLVKNGSLNLKVVATRAEGFTAPIAITMLYNPPGVSSSGSISIPEKQNEATIPLTAAGGAAVRKSKIVVLGSAPHGGATVEVATQLADLDVAEPYVALTFAKSAVEKGQELAYQITVEKKRDFAGEADIELLGLPAGATAEPRKFAAAATSVDFTIKTTPECRPGKYNLLARVVPQEAGEPVTHTLGSGELRVDEPRPAKPAAAPAPAPMPAPMPAAEAAPAPKKPLSRLEQLRQEKQGAK